MNRYIAGLAQVSAALGISLGCYLVSAHVAAERAGVAGLRVQIARDAEAMRALDAELHTRARLPQLQSWNDEALLMSAPAPAQMLAVPAQLVGYLPGGGVAPAVVHTVAREGVADPKPLPTVEPAATVAAPMMAAQIAVRHLPSPALAALEFPASRQGEGGRAARSILPRTAGGTGAPAPGRRSAPVREHNPMAELAVRAPRADPATDVADLTSAIGRELRRADAPVRRASFR